MSNAAASKDETINLKIPGWILEAVKEDADKQGSSVQTFIINAIIKAITRQ